MKDYIIKNYKKLAFQNKSIMNIFSIYHNKNQSNNKDVISSIISVISLFKTF